MGEQTCTGCGQVIERTPGSTVIREEVVSLVYMDDGTLDFWDTHPETSFYHPACWDKEIEGRG